MSARTLALTDTLRDYLVGTTVHEAPVLARLREETAKLPGAGMQISPEQGAFMAFLVRVLGVRRYLEVGVFTGYSSLTVALALADDARIVALDQSDEWTRVARRYWEEAGVSPKIDLRLGPGATSLAALLESGARESFDFAFFDADKEGVLDYFELGLKLVRSGGVLAFDNALWGGSVADPKDQAPDTVALRALNEKASRDPRVQSTLVPIGDGLLLSMKR